MTARRRRRALVLGALVVVCASGCGSLGSTTVTDIDPQEVPYGLLDVPTEPLTAGSELSTPGTQAVTPVFLLAREGGLLESSPTGVETGTPADVAREALARLEAGPTEDERSQGLGTVLGTAVTLSLDDLRGGTARVEVELTAGELAADQVPLALGQVVLTLTAVPGIERVQLVSGGEPVEMALPGGRLTTDPVTADDYAELVVPATP